MSRSAGTNGIPSNAQIQIGEIKVQGAELEGRGEVLPGFEIVFTGSYTDAASRTVLGTLRYEW